jgi:hypothetical protein
MYCDLPSLYVYLLLLSILFYCGSPILLFRRKIKVVGTYCIIDTWYTRAYTLHIEGRNALYIFTYSTHCDKQSSFPVVLLMQLSLIVAAPGFLNSSCHFTDVVRPSSEVALEGGGDAVSLLPWLLLLWEPSTRSRLVLLLLFLLDPLLLLRCTFLFLAPRGRCWSTPLLTGSSVALSCCSLRLMSLSCCCLWLFLGTICCICCG